MNEDNMKLWNDRCKTDPKQTKKAKLGAMSITAICPQYQRKNATEEFGPFGIGWSVVDEEFSTKDFKDGTVLGNYNGRLKYKYNGNQGEFPICANVKVAYTTGTGKYKVDDDWMKKASTDALTKGLSMLGFNADIFLGLFDDNKYVKQMEAEHKKPAPVKQTPQDAALSAILKAEDTKALEALVARFEASDKLEYDEALKEAVEARKRALWGE